MLELSEVTLSYPRRPVLLEGLSVTIGRGSSSAVLGPNGAGKSTLLDICLGWRRPHSGTVRLDGRLLGELSRRERGRKISLVPQRENIRFDFTVLEYVLLGRAPYLHPLGSPGEGDREIAREALSTAGILDLEDEPITHLSGGEYQLMLIARSLVQEPEVLLLDEPTSQLDPANRARITACLERLSRSGMAVFFTTHDPAVAASSAAIIHLLRGGRFIASGAPADVLSEGNLEEVYGVRPSVRWEGRHPFILWAGDRSSAR